MEVLDHFSIPFIGLKIGLHQLKFEVDNAFFAQFDSSIVQKGNLDVVLDLDKRASMSIMEFSLEGHVGTDCDRCTAAIDLPVEGNYKLHAKYSDEKVEGDDEVIFIDPKSSSLNVAQYIYEFIHLSIPLIKTYDCESDPDANCDEEILNKFDENTNDNDEERSNPMWDALNDLNLDQ